MWHSVCQGIVLQNFYERRDEERRLASWFEAVNLAVLPVKKRGGASFDGKEEERCRTTCN